MKTKPIFYAYILFSIPGVMLHEFSHLLFCQLVGVKVFRVKFFQLKQPAGYVEHAQPRNYLQSFFISVGPLIFGALVSLLLFFFTIYSCRNLINQISTNPLLLTTYYLLLISLALWFGLSIAVSSFPSTGDAKVLLLETNRHLFQRFNPLVIIGYPFILIIKLANYLKRFYFDWFYTLFLLILAWWIVRLVTR